LEDLDAIRAKHTTLAKSLGIGAVKEFRGKLSGISKVLAEEERERKAKEQDSGAVSNGGPAKPPLFAVVMQLAEIMPDGSTKSIFEAKSGL